MAYAEVFKGEELLAKGTWVAGKVFRPGYPDQNVVIIKNGIELEFKHNDEDNVYFIVYNSQGELSYDSRERIDHDEERFEAKSNLKITCSTCGNPDATVGEMRWVSDRYGMPYKKCCSKCYEHTQQDIAKFSFDKTYAGENLDEDY